MRKLILIATVIAMSGATYADIQAPPGSHYNSTRKLGRALSNILYGSTEIIDQVFTKGRAYGVPAGGSYGLVEGTSRTLARMRYGFYELFTFHSPTHHGTFKQPYERCGQDWRIEMNPHDGLQEFPPELGWSTFFGHSRRSRP